MANKTRIRTLLIPCGRRRMAYCVNHFKFPRKCTYPPPPFLTKPFIFVAKFLAVFHMNDKYVSFYFSLFYVSFGTGSSDGAFMRLFLYYTVCCLVSRTGDQHSLINIGLTDRLRRWDRPQVTIEK